MLTTDMELLTVVEMARLLKTTVRGVRARHLRGALPPAIRTGRMLRWDAVDVRRWLDAHKGAKASPDASPDAQNSPT